MAGPSDPFSSSRLAERVGAGLLPASTLRDMLGNYWDVSLVGFCLTNARGVIVAINPAFCESVGYSNDELVGASITRLLAPEAAVSGAVSHAAFINGDDDAAEDTTYVHRSGRPLFVHASDSRLRAPTGGVFRLTSLIDLGKQAQATRQLRQLQRADHFTALASDISNDFNNLLSIILGYTALLQESQTVDRRVQVVDGIESAVRRAATLIKQTLFLSRKGEPTYERVQPREFFNDMSRLLPEGVGGGQMEFTLVMEDALPPISVDPVQVCHAFSNLCLKARELAGAGGSIALRASAACGELVRKRLPEAQEPLYLQVRLRVSPPPGSLAIFDQESQRWDAAVRFVEKRRDLSTLVAHSIVTAHRGHLEIEAGQGPWLDFVLYFPALVEARSEPEMAPQPALVRPRAAGRFVLLVDDEETLLHALCFTLERNGFQVVKARDGQEAVDAFIKHQQEIALVLIDLGLPHMSGWEALVKIREREPNVNAVVMSGHLETNLQREIIKAGARGFLQKPFAIAQALREVQRLFAEMGLGEPPAPGA